MSKRMIVFGGDGFCGWPTSLGLSRIGYEVTIVDNLSRRKIDQLLYCESLTPIAPIEERIRVWKKLTGIKINFINIDLSSHYRELLEIIRKINPLAVIHFAEQRAAPYSMKSSAHKRYTVNNNINATNNILCALVESGCDTHLIHLGTTGVYGYSSIGMQIPEGYLPVKIDIDGEEKTMEILYPPDPGSVYHLTKCQDALSFLYFNKNDGIRITDLHQGIVWGTQTPETKMDERLINRFDYDGDFGTVLNRFLVQASVGHPLTIHGTGGQTRAFININDTVSCIKLAIRNPPKRGDRVKICNQTTECFNIKRLALKVKEICPFPVEIRYYKNPRNEDAENRLEFKCESLMRMGLKPTTLSNRLVDEILDVACKYKERCKKEKIICTSTWRNDMIVDKDGSANPVY